jgi:hypothetical protein
MLRWPSPGALIAVAALFSAVAAVAAAVASWRTAAEQDRQITILEAWTTGADSFGYFVPLLQSQRLAFFLQHAGRYPAFDVNVRVYRGGSLQGPIYFGTLSSGSGVDWLTLPSLEFPRTPSLDQSPLNVRIEIQTRNGIVVQNVALRALNGRWHTDSSNIERVTRHEMIAPIPLGRLNPGRIKEAQDQ